MKQSNSKNHDAASSHSKDDWIMAYENFVSQSGPEPEEFPENLSGEAQQQLVEVRQTIDALHAVYGQADESPESSASEPPPQQLGDFRILHEVGHGGMGVVYEAEQISLPRRVALKILPFAAVLDPRHLERFKNEARAAASLDHPGIVSVYLVGTERGIHYYAMQFIEGQSLAELIDKLQTDFQVEQETTDRMVDRTESANELGLVTSWRSHLAGDSSQKQAFFHQIARLGMQAAAALDHAHARGIVHRDIKPGNLLLDTEGKVHVADFGLARIEADAGITMTGDILGTLRYMSPEQALAQRAVIDHRTDIYSLGATLYELITLRPLFEGQDRATLLRKIALEEPKPPGKVTPGIPRDLETIILKALEKDCKDRYVTASELADDLESFLDDRPIMARPASLTSRAVKWSKRHQPVIWSGIVLLMIATVVLATSTVIVLGQKRQTAHALKTAEEAVDYTEKLLYVRDLSLAARARKDGDMRHSASLLRGNPAFEDRPELQGFEWHYLRQLVLAENVTLTQTEGEVFIARYSPDSRQIAIGALDGSIEIWDANTRQRLRVLQGHTDEIRQLAFHPEGQQLASASEDGTVRIWHLSSSEKETVLQENPGGITTTVCYSPDGKTLATGGDDNLVKLWSVSPFKLMGTLAGHTDFVRCLAFVMEGKTLASGSDDGTIKLWEVGSHQLVDTLNGDPENENPSWILSLTTEPQGKFLFSGDHDNTIRIWDLHERNCISVIRGHLDGVQALAFLDSSNRLVSGDRGGTIRTWDLSEIPANLGAQGEYLQGHTGSICSIDVSTDGRHLLTAGQDGTVRIWFPEPGEASFKAAIKGREIRDFMFLDHGSTTVILENSGVSFWDSHTGSFLKSFSHQATTSPYCVTVSEKEKRVAVAYANGPVVLYSDTVGAALEIAPSPTKATVERMVFSPDGTSLATAIETRNQLRVWDTSTGAMLAELEVTEECLTFSPDGNLLACADYNECVLVSTETWQEVFRLSGHSSTISDVAFNSQGTRLATSGHDRKIILWDTTSWTPHSKINAHKARVESIAFSPDGRTLASGARDGTIKLWHVELGLEFFELEQQPLSVVKLAFSPNGQQLLGKLDPANSIRYELVVVAGTHPP